MPGSPGVSWPIRVCGRLFSEKDVETIRTILASNPAPCRAEAARRTCEELRWRTAVGGLKAMSCRVAMLRLEERGLIELPSPRNGNGNGQRYQSSTGIEAPISTIKGSAGSLGELQLRQVEKQRESRQWNEAVARFHYLGYTPLPGAQIRYLIEADAGLLGAIGFGAAAWKVAPRDTWIGWTAKQREEKLHLVLNNARFLILPWVRSRNLASRILGLCARRLGQDFETRYGYRPVLLETFVERSRFAGTCYRAANWVYVGDTQGRGKLDRYMKRALPVKRVFVYPLAPSLRHVLCG